MGCSWRARLEAQPVSGKTRPVTTCWGVFPGQVSDAEEKRQLQALANALGLGLERSRLFRLEQRIRGLAPDRQPALEKGWFNRLRPVSADRIPLVAPRGQHHR